MRATRHPSGSAARARAPIIEDKLWFFTTGNFGKSKAYLPGIFFSDNDPTTPEGIGDDRRVFRDGSGSQLQGRITHQLTPRNKMTHYLVTHQSNFNRSGAAGLDGFTAKSEALFWGDAHPAYLYTTRWTAPVTNRVLFEVAGSFERQTLHIGPHELTMNSAPFLDQARGVASGKSFVTLEDEGYRRELQGSVSYVTGSHNFKAGMVYRNNIQYFKWPSTGDIFQAWTLNGNPFALLVMANSAFKSPLQNNCDCAIFAQDAWTMGRLTLNLGLRYDLFRNSVPAGERAAGFFAPALPFDGIDDIPNWKDWSPRAGMAFDLFGDGRTALKATVGQFVANESLGITGAFSPLGFGSSIDFRFWNDLNGDGTILNPDGTPQLDEVAPSFNPNYGNPVLSNRFDSTTDRGKNWEYSAGVQHQLLEGWSVSGMWHRRRYYNFRWVDNLNLSASDYVPGTVHCAGRPAPGERRRRADHRSRVAPGLPILDGGPAHDAGVGGLADLERVRGDCRRGAAAGRLHDGELDGREERGPLLPGRPGQPQRPPVLPHGVAVPAHG